MSSDDRKKEEFACQYGYLAFDEMLKRSTLIFHQFEENWYITPLERGFLAWVEPFFDQILGCFETFEEAEKVMDKIVRELSIMALKLQEL